MQLSWLGIGASDVCTTGVGSDDLTRWGPWPYARNYSLARKVVSSAVSASCRTSSASQEPAMRNVKLALRTLARTPFVTVVAVLSLGLGIGANSAIYSIFY